MYLIFHRSLRFLKELFVASLYTTGVLLLSVTVTPLDVNTPQYLLIFQFAIAAWSNLVLFSWFDRAFDKRNDQNSFVTILGKNTAQTFLYSLFGVSFFLSAVQMRIGTPLPPVFILLLMNVTLFVIFVFRRSLEKDDKYRVIGDAVFLLPSLLLIL
jgi:4-hydroxybenzoate polyprenyltransferase